MAFPSDKSNRVVDPAIDLFKQGRREAGNVKNMAMVVPVKFAAKNMSGNLVVSMINTLKTAIDVLERGRAVSGMRQYVRSAYKNQAMDIIKESQATESACIIVRDLLIGKLPTDGTYLLKDKINADGSISVRPFTPAEMVDVFTKLNDLAATIE